MIVCSSFLSRLAMATSMIYLMNLWFNTPRDKDISWILDGRRQIFYDCVKSSEK